MQEEEVRTLDRPMASERWRTMVSLDFLGELMLIIFSPNKSKLTIVWRPTKHEANKVNVFKLTAA